uniref:Uncharacterized protein n=1 Tax=Aegilops tauschii TaxID=37682 RepID=M8CDL6_AEGTA
MAAEAHFHRELIRLAFEMAYKGFLYLLPQPPPGPAAPAASDEVRTLWIGDLQYWMDENYIYSCFANTGEEATQWGAGAAAGAGGGYYAGYGQGYEAYGQGELSSLGRPDR